MEQKALVVGADVDRWGTPLAAGPWVKISAGDTAGAWVMIQTWVPPGLGVPLHLHHQQDEWFWITDGEFLFDVGGQLLTLTAGMSILVPRRTPHRFQNSGHSTATMLGLVQPALMFEELMDEIRRLPVAERAGPRARDIFARHDSELLGPPLPVLS